ncbi:MAG: hypothetical protein ACI8YQ_002723 [Polaribacter sp.]|jgi:hypothetical protein
MSTLDDDFGFIDPSTVKPWPVALRYGGLATVISIIIGLLMHLFGLSDIEGQAVGELTLLDQIVQYINYAIWIGAPILAIRAHKSEDLGGYISFGRAFLTGFATNLIIGLISAVWTYIFFTILAPEALDILLEGTLSQMPEDQAEQSEDIMKMVFTPGLMAGMVVFMSLFIGTIVSLITGLVVKNDHPNA